VVEEGGGGGHKGGWRGKGGGVRYFLGDACCLRLKKEEMETGAVFYDGKEGEGGWRWRFIGWQKEKRGGRN